MESKSSDFEQGQRVFDISDPEKLGIVRASGPAQTEVKFAGEGKTRIIINRFLRLAG